ncbi:hypothetical protein, partial [Streptococcus equi]|uniref:hypothetical protein n=1 Tax=Streptococcus equi TaxID=1336 RepID=UPI001BDE5681
NKGPISYDRVLLKPHGKAIMDGLGNSMKTNFKDIQKDVSGMADDLTRSFSNQKVQTVFCQKSILLSLMSLKNMRKPRLAE